MSNRARRNVHRSWRPSAPSIAAEAIEAAMPAEYADETSAAPAHPDAGEEETPSRRSLRAPERRKFRNSATLRRLTILAELTVGFAICFLGYQYLIDPIRDVEIAVVVWICHLLGAENVSGAVDNALLLSRPGEVPVLAAFTASCSSLLAILALAALVVTVMRRRGGHAFLAFLAAAVVVFIANALRIVLVVLAGLEFGTGALVLFHDWAGTILNFVYTFAGLLLMISITLPTAGRAEQSASGQHIASRPSAWGRQGLGYRLEEGTRRPPARRTLMGLISRHLPRSVSTHLANQREANRVDYRLGHMSPQARAARIRQLADDGLSAHAATLLAVASYDEDPMVLDTLAEVVAARQWEPVTSDKVYALRLWARGWTLRETPHPDQVHLPVQRAPESVRIVAVTGAGGPAGVTVIRSLAARGYTVIALDANPASVGFHLAAQGVQVPLASDERYMDVLFDVVRSHRVEALICTVAEEYPTLVPLAPKLAALGCKTWFPTLEAVEACIDKVKFAETLATSTLEVNHPVTATSEIDLPHVPGPWVVKPADGRGSRNVVLVDDIKDLFTAFRSVPNAICQTRASGREFTADALVDRHGRLVTCVPRWRSEVKAGISVKGETFDSADVTAAVEDTLTSVGLTGPANVQGFVADDGTVTIIEVNPRFSGGLPLTLAAGADVVGAYLSSILDEKVVLQELTFAPGTSMLRHHAEVFLSPTGVRLPDPLQGGSNDLSVARGTFASSNATV